MDFRRFLHESNEIVAPVVGRNVWLDGRRLGFDIQDGWYCVRVRGRAIEVVRPANLDEVKARLSRLPGLRGPVLRWGRSWRLVESHGCRPVELAPVDEDAAKFAPLLARVWDELLVWDEIEWEGENEAFARNALEEGRGLGARKGISAALRAAFAFAVAAEASRAVNVPVAPAELWPWVRQIAKEGASAAEDALRRLAVERAVWSARRPVAPPRVEVRVDLIESRIEESLRGAGARLFGVRRLGGGQAEVRWQLEGTRLISIVEVEHLRVLDAGVCLAGEQELVTLDSLPGVIRQAMREQALVITRHEDDDVA